MLTTSPLSSSTSVQRLPVLHLIGRDLSDLYRHATADEPRRRPARLAIRVQACSRLTELGPAASVNVTQSPVAVESATCGSSCLGAGLLYWLMVSLGLGCLPQVITRGEIRKMHGMQLDSTSDWLIACCCSPCGLCQEAREVEIRSGSGATLGSAGATSAAPPQTQTMTQTH